MREIRKSGSEGGAAQANESSLPLCVRNPTVQGKGATILESSTESSTRSCCLWISHTGNGRQ